MLIKHIALAALIVSSTPALAIDLSAYTDGQLDAMQAVCGQQHATISSGPHPSVTYDADGCSDVLAEVKQRRVARDKAMFVPPSPAPPSGLTSPAANDAWLKGMLGQ